MENYEPKSRTVTFLLCLFFGALGIHRFYVGKAGTGVIYLLTGGLLMIGVVVDLIRISFGLFSDSAGNSLSEWTPIGCVMALIGILIASGAGVIGFLAAFYGI